MEPDTENGSKVTSSSEVGLPESTQRSEKSPLSADEILKLKSPEQVAEDLGKVGLIVFSDQINSWEDDLGNSEYQATMGHLNYLRKSEGKTLSSDKRNKLHEYRVGTEFGKLERARNWLSVAKYLGKSPRGLQDIENPTFATVAENISNIVRTAVIPAEDLINKRLRKLSPDFWPKNRELTARLEKEQAVEDREKAKGISTGKLTTSIGYDGESVDTGLTYDDAYRLLSSYGQDPRFPGTLFKKLLAVEQAQKWGHDSTAHALDHVLSERRRMPSVYEVLDQILVREYLEKQTSSDS